MDHKAEAAQVPHMTGHRVWPWLVLLATIQVLVVLCLWHHIRAEAAVYRAIDQQLGLAGAAGDPGWVILYTKPVTVMVKKGEIEDTATIVVRYGADQFKYGTQIFCSDKESWTEWIKKGVGWKGKYLLVLNDGSGTDWRAATDAVLMLRGGELVEVGSIARNHQDNDDPLGPGYHDGFFHDVFDKFEGDVGGFGSKGVGWPITMREANGKFVVDLDRTWAENEARIRTNEAYAVQMMKEVARDKWWPDDLLATLGENVLIAKYCRREQEAAIRLQRARKVMDKQQRSRLSDMLKELVPGELPFSGFP